MLKIVKECYPYGKAYVKLINISESNKDLESRIELVSDIAGLCYGNEGSANPYNLVMNTMPKRNHMSPREFIRVRPYCIEDSWRNKENLPYDEPISSDSINRKNFLYLFKLKIPMTIKNQLMRHRNASYMELSRRFTKDSKKQFEFDYPDRMPKFWRSVMKVKNFLEVKMYNAMIKMKVPAEIARVVIGMNVYTEYFFMCNKEEFQNVIFFRDEEHAQLEAQIIAHAMRQEVEEYLGITIEPKMLIKRGQAPSY